MTLEKFAHDHRACVTEALDDIAKECRTTVTVLGVLAALSLAAAGALVIGSPSSLMLSCPIAVLAIFAAAFAVNNFMRMRRVRCVSKSDGILELCEAYLNATDACRPLEVRPLTQALRNNYGNLSWRVADVHEVIDSRRASWELWLVCEDVEDAKNAIIEVPHPVARGTRLIPSRCLVIIDPITRRLDLNVPADARWVVLDLKHDH